VGAAATGLAVYHRQLPAGARPLLLVGAGLAMVGLVARVAAERAAVGASLADLVASDTGRNLAWLAAGVLASATAAGLLAARIRQLDGPDRAAVADDGQARPSDGVGRGWLAAVGLTAAAAMGLQVQADHAAAPSALRLVNLLAQWLHLLAAGVWAGGLVWLLAGLLSHSRKPSQSGAAIRDATVDRIQAVLRFSRLALPVVVVLAVTGLNRALDLAGGWSGLTRTGLAGSWTSSCCCLPACWCWRPATATGCCPPWPDHRVAWAPYAAASPPRLGSWLRCCWPRPC
jgi:putative copper export protein